jgi:hypothetical protein
VIETYHGEDDDAGPEIANGLKEVHLDQDSTQPFVMGVQEVQQGYVQRSTYAERESARRP